MKSRDSVPFCSLFFLLIKIFTSLTEEHQTPLSLGRKAKICGFGIGIKSISMITKVGIRTYSSLRTQAKKFCYYEKSITLYPWEREKSFLIPGLITIATTGLWTFHKEQATILTQEQAQENQKLTTMIRKEKCKLHVWEPFMRDIEWAKWGGGNEE